MSGSGRKFRNGRERKAALIAAARVLLPDSGGWDAKAVHEAIKEAHKKHLPQPNVQAERYVGEQFAEREKRKKHSKTFLGWYDSDQKAGAPSPTPSTYRAARAAEDAYFLALAEAMIGKPASIGGRARGAQSQAAAKGGQIPAVLKQARADRVPGRKLAAEVAKRLNLSTAYVRKELRKLSVGATPSATKRATTPGRSRRKA